MPIIPEYVEASVGSSSIEKYRALGYQDLKVGRKATIKVADLPPTSSTIVPFKCEHCGEVVSTYKFEKVRRYTICGLTFCHKCVYDIDASVPPPAKESWGEAFVRSWLQRNQLDFRMQVRRKGLDGVYRNPLMFDFAVIGALGQPVLFIEYDGPHHYRPYDYEGKGEEKTRVAFALQQEYDRRKDRYCARNNVPMLRLKYDLSERELAVRLGQAVLGLREVAA